MTEVSRRRQDRKHSIARAHTKRYAKLEGGFMTKNTDSKNLRTRLGESFDEALRKPVSVTRGSDRFILMNEEEYLNLKDEVLSLRKNLFSVLQVVDGKAQSFNNSEEGINRLFDELSKEREKAADS